MIKQASSLRASTVATNPNEVIAKEKDSLRNVFFLNKSLPAFGLIMQFCDLRTQKSIACVDLNLMKESKLYIAVEKIIKAHITSQHNAVVMMNKIPNVDLEAAGLDWKQFVIRFKKQSPESTKEFEDFRIQFKNTLALHRAALDDYETSYKVLLLKSLTPVNFLENPVLRPIVLFFIKNPTTTDGQKTINCRYKENMANSPLFLPCRTNNAPKY
ncbi:MAG: hypothetical protein V4629_08060 [Pseudomonadota bacterium]